MAKLKIDPGDLQATLNSILEEYAGDVLNATNEAAKTVAEYGADQLRERARMSGIGGHKYVRSFKSRLLTQSRLGNVYVIYSTQYRVAHLLEHGHVVYSHGKRTGKRTRAYRHWSYVEADTIKRLEQDVRSQIRKI